MQTHCLTCGVRVLSALQLCAYLPELGARNRRQIAKLAGLAPLPSDFGKLHGVRRIQYGSAPAGAASTSARWSPRAGTPPSARTTSNCAPAPAG